jgi:RNA 2',3'-cyclic 3'-phosphodiesterase
MPRLFCALKIPGSLGLQLSLIKGGLSGARWVEPDDYHITLCFFGDMNRDTANDLALSLSRISQPELTLKVDRLDTFGKSKPRALIAHIKPNTSLNELHSEIEWMARRLGITPDKRKFLPHITLARLKGTTPLELAGFITTRGGFYSAPFVSREFELMSSKDSIGGGPYVTEARYPLQNQNIR